MFDCWFPRWRVRQGRRINRFPNRGNFWRRGIAARERADQRTQSFGVQRASGASLRHVGWPGFAQSGLLAPTARTDTESLLEAGIEETQMVEAALFSHVNHLGINIAEEGNRLEQAHFHP